ncbi:type IV fimbrial biogenesis protein FimT [Tahibacter aquaticus]|uniref:Type II secretion system protein H n=1 Tax=Tahibacter aquaticus TaxID=520092 RepID=A0A4R6YWM2_9GAMM|nr:GspH/FimT family pseudopilin [Tahibacter aquaticus]TDR43181.1 type IV fimbrial biogenesis protein FimT [Tahibacter aquaticus]
MQHFPGAAQRGISLIELLSTLGLIGVGLAVALPWLGDFNAGAQLRGSTHQWMTTLATARSSAVSSAQVVVACPAQEDHCLRTPWWHQGWILFLDGDRNGERDAAEPILLRDTGQTGVQIAGSSGRPRIRYLPDGSSEGSNVTLTFCNRGGAASARTIVVNNAGRARTGSATAAQAATACAGIGA